MRGVFFPSFYLSKINYNESMANLGYIQLTRKCNQKCIICSNPENENTLDFSEAKEQVDALKKEGYEGIIFTGGEPTLYKNIFEIIKYCKNKKIHPRIITNGQLLADFKFLEKLKKAGLDHAHVSIYSCRDNIQAKISKNKNSLKNIEKALSNLKKIGGIRTDINTAISKYNAGHLFETVRWIVKKFPFITHFVFNNLDPFMNRASKNPGTVPRLNDFELELHKALEYLTKNKKTFRVERVPLCYLTDFEFTSTETRKMVKSEERAVYFLDSRGKVRQKDWNYKKSENCSVCSLKSICAGLYGLGKFYSENELYPVFIEKDGIIKKIKSET